MSGGGAPRKVDPVTEELVRSSLVAITDEMKTNLMRTAYNLVIYEAQDFTVGLFDVEGRTVSIGLGLPMFIHGLSETVRAQCAVYGAESLEQGDILLTNDAYVTGSHLNHMVVTAPIFVEGEVVGFASSMAHWMDVGGVLGGTTLDIYSEGLQVPVVKLFKRGKQDDEITRLIEMNVRFSDLAMGDLRAQVSSIRTGEARVRALMQRYGKEVVLSSITDLFARSERAARDVVREIPDGRYVAEAFMDDDGVQIGRPVPIAVVVEVLDDHMTIDLSGVSPQVGGYYNSGVTAGLSAARVAFKCITSPETYPINDGSFRPVEVILPSGTVVSATRPAAMRWWMTYPMTVVDCIFRALADVTDRAAIAGHHADLCVVSFYGTNKATGRFFMGSGGLSGGGWGATSRGDGNSATVCINDGDTHNQPVEAMEMKYPVVVEEYALRIDSGGPGTSRGGLGTRRVVRQRAAVRLNSAVERTKDAPWGVAGGQPALPNRISVRRANGETICFPNGKIDGMSLVAGDAYVVETGGGGGYGEPRKRSPASVLEDVRRGYVSGAQAREAYGVEVRRGGRAWEWAVETQALDGRGAQDGAQDGVEDMGGPAGISTLEIEGRDQ